MPEEEASNGLSDEAVFQYIRRWHEKKGPAVAPCIECSATPLGPFQVVVAMPWSLVPQFFYGCLCLHCAESDKYKSVPVVDNPYEE